MLTSSSLVYVFLFYLFIFQLVHCQCPKDFQCGTYTLSFPFSKRSKPNCGLFLVECDYPKYPDYPMIQIEPGGYWIVFSQSKNTVYIVPSFQGEENCNVFNNMALPQNNSAISFSTSFANITMLKCDTNSSNQSLDDLGYKKFSKCEKEHHFNIYYNYSDGMILDPVGNDFPSGCSIIQWPTGNRTFDPQFEQQLFHLLDAGLSFSWDLYGSCKECYLNNPTEHGCIVNYDNFTCSIPSKEAGDRKLGLIIGTVVSGVILIFAIMACCLGKHYLVNHSIFWGTKRLEHKNMEKFLKSYGSLGPKRYRYSDIKRMTSSFKVKIGQGGFGSVFKGCLVDGSPVAVKLLNDSKGSGEEFINEVASISRTSHVNIVKLLGFCFEGNKRALVYEFVSKGSLEKFIYDGKSSSSDYQIGMQELFKIAIGVARGLEYLHRLCGTRIVHFDVKPHNILLDEEFTPKISDFGLAKSCPQEYSSIISLSAARGTIGYIAPEVVCRYLGGVSHKSDVYSYGMMVLEIVGARRNVDNGVDSSSQIYMPHWIYNQIETNQDVNFLDIGNHKDDEFARKMIIVSFWCIQTDPSSRPTMTRVVEMLESKIESLQIPPRPYLFSSANSPFNQSMLERQHRPGMDEVVEDSEMAKDGNSNSEIMDGAVDDDILGTLPCQKN